MDHPPPPPISPSPKATDILEQTREKKGERKRDKVNKGLKNRKTIYSIFNLARKNCSKLYR